MDKGLPTMVRALLGLIRDITSLYFLYLFEDAVLRTEEEKTLYRRFDERLIDREGLGKGLKHAGRILIISDLNIEGKVVFLMYKQRGGVENLPITRLLQDRGCALKSGSSP